MPYRRLPNTDAARIKALKTAVEKAEKTDFKKLSLSSKIISTAKDVLDHFQALNRSYQQYYTSQVNANKLFANKVKSARMYVSHFIQVLYMSVIRSEIKENQLELYQLESENLVVPDLSSHEQLLEWGQKIIDGEKKRVSQGGAPIFNPSIAKVNVMYTVFREGYRTQKLHQKGTSRVLNEVSSYREIVDKVILDIWDEVEKSNINLPLEKRIDKNKEYGIVYYYRKGETVL